MTSGKRSERLPVVVTASVGPDGRVVPGSGSAGGPVQRIGQELSDRARVGAESPCAETPALAAHEARRLVEVTAREEQFEPALVMAVAKAESDFLSTSVSPKGAYGLMQLMPATAQAFGVNICDPKDNVRGGIAFLRELTAKYRNPVYVLAAYNAGEPAILKAKGVPPISETVGYVAAVLNDFYEWPANPGRTDSIGAAPGRPQRSASASAEARPSRPARRGTQGEANGWQGGFVQNFD